MAEKYQGIESLANIQGPMVFNFFKKYFTDPQEYSPVLLVSNIVKSVFQGIAGFFKEGAS
jgi:hypothetical protein